MSDPEIAYVVTIEPYKGVFFKFVWHVDISFVKDHTSIRGKSGWARTEEMARFSANRYADECMKADAKRKRDRIIKDEGSYSYVYHPEEF